MAVGRRRITVEIAVLAVLALGLLAIGASPVAGVAPPAPADAATEALDQSVCPGAALNPVAVVNGSTLCTHGSDPRAVADTPQSSGPVPELECIGSGSDGARVHVVYARPADKPDHYASVVATLRSYVAAIDDAIDDSAARTGGTRHVRWLTDAGCQVVVDNVVLGATGDDSFANTISALDALGYDRTSRKYLVWMDSSGNGICGMATRWVDDSAGIDNDNNANPSYARVDSPCWSAGAAGHELMHMLGAVQGSAPHVTAAGHCRDDYDQMCYDDGSGPPAIVCPAPADERLFDCGNDDYFSTAAAPGSYLATHWNSAGSRWLSGPGVPAYSPANDDFSQAAALSGANGAPHVVTGTNRRASSEPGEPNHAGVAGGRSVWYRLDATASGTATLDTFDSGIDTLLAVYTGGDVGALTPVGSNDDDGGLRFSRVQVPVLAGVSYHVAVDGKAGAAGSLSLTWQVAPRRLRPDAQIRKAGQTTFKGDGVYNTDGSGQTASANLARGASVDFTVKVENDGNVADRFLLTGTAAGAGFSARYYDAAGAEITAAVLAGTYDTGSLAPRASRTIRVRVKARSAAVVGASQTVVITARSAQGPTRVDVVRATASVTT